MDHVQISGSETCNSAELLLNEVTRILSRLLINNDLMTFYMWAYMQILNLLTYMAHDVAK